VGFEVLEGFLRAPSFDNWRAGRPWFTVGSPLGRASNRWFEYRLSRPPAVEIRGSGWSTVGRAGVIPAGVSGELVLRVAGARRTGARVRLTLPEPAVAPRPTPESLPLAREYRDFPIYQDDPDSPLPVSSFMLGPFTLPEDERFFEVRTEGRSRGLDLDLFVYEDRNHNRRIDGEEERVAASTTPSATERVTISSPGGRVFWILGQGWHVPPLPEQEPEREDRASMLARLRRGEPPSRAARADFFLSALPLPAPPPEEAARRAAAERDAHPEIDVSRLDPRGRARVSVRFGTPSADRKVTITLPDESEPVLVTSAEGTATYERELDPAEREPGRYEIEVTWREGETAGRETVVWTIPAPPLKERPLAVLPADGATVHDRAQTITIYFDERPDELTLRVDGRDLGELLVFTPHSAILVPEEQWSPGEHTIVVTARSADGAEQSLESRFEVAESAAP
jgi:hypothetical protein